MPKNGTHATNGKLEAHAPAASYSSAPFASSSSCCPSTVSCSSASATTVLPPLPFWLLPYPFGAAAVQPQQQLQQQQQCQLINQWAAPSAAMAPNAVVVPPTMGRPNLFNALNGTNGIETFVPSSFASSLCASSAYPSASFPSANPSAPNDVPFVDRIGESARNRFGRPYISGRPLLLCDRQKIIKMYRDGRRKIAIAREIGVTHSCVSKVIRRFEETGMLESKNSRTASCACPGDADGHDPRICRHARFVHHLSASSSSTQLPSFEMNKIVAPNRRLITQHNLPKKFSIEWILSEHCPS